jgi:hypothetical protein
MTAEGEIICVGATSEQPATTKNKAIRKIRDNGVFILAARRFLFFE